MGSNQDNEIADFENLLNSINLTANNSNIDNDLFCSIISGDIDLLEILDSDNIELLEYYLPYIFYVVIPNNDYLFTEDLEYLFYSSKLSKLINKIDQYKSIDYNQINEFINNQMQIRKKLSHVDKKDTYLDSISNPKSHFENGDAEKKLRLVLCDLIALLEYTEMQQSQTISRDTKYEALFLDTQIYFHELNIILPIICFKCLKYIDFNKLILSILFLNNQYGYLVKAKRVLFDICTLSSYCSRFIRTELLNRQLLPDLVFSITSQFIKDEIDILSKIITNRSENQWLKEYISNNSKDQQSTFHEIRDRLLTTLKNIYNYQEKFESLQKQYINSNNEKKENLLKKLNSKIVEQSYTVKLIIRLYCGFSGLLGVKMNQQEITTSLSFLEKSIFKNYSKIFLCFLLVCEGLVKSIQSKSVVGYLNHLSKVGNCDELLLLISIYFHTHQLQNIALLVKNILGFRPSIHTESLNQIGEILTKEIYTESLVAKRAISLPTIENLNSNDQNISIVCVYHLLSERIFEKYETDVGQWVWTQLLKSSKPIHYLLPSLLDQFIKNIIEPSITTFYMKRISEISIMNSINSSSNIVKVLIIYFILRFNDTLMKHKTEQKGKPVSFLIETTQLREYNIEFLSKLPIQNCINLILSNQLDYFYIIPPFLYLISSQFPQFFNVNLLLLEEERLSNPIEKLIFYPKYYSDKSTMSVEFLKESLVKTLDRPTSTQLILRYLNTLSTESLLVYSNVLIEYLLPILVKNRILPSVEGLISSFTDIWMRVFSVNQTSVALKTINILISIDGSGTSQDGASFENSGLLGLKYTYSDIISDPLIVFRSHPTVFTCPPLLKILLQILFFYMVSSKKNLQNQIQVSTTNKQEDISTLILTQESSIIQILLEICIIDRFNSGDAIGSDFGGSNIKQTGLVGINKILKREGCINENGIKNFDEVDIEEIRCLVCSFIHQIFIDKPLIIKLIHFQGYLSQLLPITVSLIPSMHICFEFIPELLNQPSLDKQIFSIQLLAYLSEKYPIPKSLKLCRLSQTRISYNLNGNTLVQEDKIKFLYSILPSITRITKSFPLVAEDFIQILMEQLPNKNNYQQNLKSYISSTDFIFNSNLNNQNNSNYNINNNSNINNQDNDLHNININNFNNNSSNNNNNNNEFDKTIYKKITKNESWYSIKQDTLDKVPPIEQEIHKTIQIIIKNLSK
ncbi:hypothetical protein DICPUDRAFT_99991 [Dictyostelium purpureum]|uniref:Integrator complex subunit 2 n=1 Tax=Dictyostelium purpureum TaxID=5786 RepID=F1A4E3_DICPU|nr:uncharacterized protein DICPUDRAFT_99991 [Dictyostelium purpureum]EGC28935.1 hypothetical protein DICPUDRAFT_99991 [Dictyostelium purpureum]|eukprot:XP_003294536.1 hypothetical protein DICPUDRAFT_99991 [Dictyostelium purpureum]